MSQLEDLRRRVYGPGATEADRERYRQALADLRPADLVPPEPALAGTGEALPSASADAPAEVGQARQPRRSPRRRRAVVVGATAVALAAAATLGLLQSGSTPTPLPRSTALPVSAAARAAFVRSLDAGGSAALSTYFYRHPDSRPMEVWTPNRSESEEHDGTGAQTVTLHPSSEADTGGHLTVVLILAEPGDVIWRATRSAVRQNQSTYTQEVAVRRGSLLPGSPESTTIRYAGSAPTALRIEPPRGARWDVTVVFTD